jgi:hypothetical protein
VTEFVKKMHVAKHDGRACIEESLEAGFDVSAAVLAAAPFDHGSFFTFISGEMSADDIRFPDAPDIPANVADQGLSQFLNELRSRGVVSLIVEDDLAERGDSGPDCWPVPSAFAGSRVVHWLQLESRSDAAAVEALKRYCTSHCLNAFISTESPAELGLVDGQGVGDGFGTKIATSLLAVIVFAFDETSFAVWDSRD